MAMVSVILTPTVGVLLDLKLLQTFYTLRGPRTPPSDVVLVGIDDETYRVLELSAKYPVPRKYIAEALETISRGNPRVVILDARLPKEEGIDDAADARIEEAIRNAPTSIWSGELPGSDGKTMVLPSAERFRAAAALELPMLVYATPLKSTEMISLTNLKARDHSLAERVPISRALTQLGGFELDNPGAEALTNFYGPAGGIPSISLSRFLSSVKNSEIPNIQGKVVIIGLQSKLFARGTMAKDEYIVPSAPLGMFGVEMHASVISNLLDRSWLRLPDYTTATIVVGLLVFLFTAYAMRSPKPLLLIGVWCGVGCLLFAHYISFSRFFFWSWGMGSVLICFLVVTIASANYMLIRALRYKKYIDTTFGFEKEREM
jgi:CHASE2 domain-containing sensor protein